MYLNQTSEEEWTNFYRSSRINVLDLKRGAPDSFSSTYSKELKSTEYRPLCPPKNKHAKWVTRIPAPCCSCLLPRHHKAEEISCRHAAEGKSFCLQSPFHLTSLFAFPVTCGKRSATLSVMMVPSTNSCGFQGCTHRQNKVRWPSPKTQVPWYL